MKYLPLTVFLLLASCGSNYLSSPLPNDMGYINVNNGLYENGQTMWTQKPFDGIKRTYANNMPFVRGPGCGHFLIGIVNGKTKDIRITEQYGSKEALKFLIWQFKKQQWIATEDNVDEKPAVVKQFASFFKEGDKVSKELATQCQLKTTS